MARYTLGILAGLVGGLLAGVALAAGPPAADAKPPDAGSPVAAKPQDGRQVAVFRLRYADPAAVVKELSGIVRSDEVRMVPFEPANVVVVLAPPAMKEAIGSLISKLDVPRPAQAAKPASPQIAEPPAVVVAPARPDLSKRPANSGPQPEPSAGTSQPPPTFAVMRAPGQVQRLVNDVLARAGTPRPSGQPQADFQDLHVRSIPSRSLGEALSRILPAGGSSRGTTITVLRVSPITLHALENAGAPARPSPVPAQPGRELEKGSELFSNGPDAPPDAPRE
jgi:hypothetical protein